MANFDKFYPGLMASEGEYCHTEGDSGGETYKGIARVYNPNWSGWTIVDETKRTLGLKGRVLPVNYPGLNKALRGKPGLAAVVKSFYKACYWDVLGLDLIKNQSLAEQMADHGVNAGTGRVGRMLQWCLWQLGVLPAKQVDGKIGRITLAAVSTADPQALFDTFSELRQACYRYRASRLELETDQPQVFTHTPKPVPGAVLLNLFEQLNITPNASQGKFLVSWLTRVRIIKFVA